VKRQRYYETIRVINVATGKSTFRARFYAQPLPRKLAALAYHHVWERLTEPAARRLEPLLTARHRRGCHDNCAVGWDTEDNLRPICAYIPVGAQRDLRCFDLSHEARQDLGEVDVEPQLAVRLGWPGEDHESQLGSVG
jgi:hypothetical protein